MVISYKSEIVSSKMRWQFKETLALFINQAMGMMAVGEYLLLKKLHIAKSLIDIFCNI